MQKVTSTMSITLKQMNLTQITTNMEQFEQINEELDLNLNMMEKSMQITTQPLQPLKDVDGLLNEIAEQHNLQLKQQFTDIGIGQKNIKKNQEKEEFKSLEKKMNALFN